MVQVPAARPLTVVPLVIEQMPGVVALKTTGLPESPLMVVALTVVVPPKAQAGRREAWQEMDKAG